ncbi:MAG: DNA/RNA non-specific endonuclease [Phycisphaerales bacterium]|nr:DNA/RNA non-specific endonuclease [Phycisphaerales bacterium]
MLLVVLAALGALVAWHLAIRPRQSPVATAPAPAESSTTTRSSGTVTFAGTFVYAGEPKRTTYPNSVTVLKNTAYLVAYDEQRENPAWAAYRLPGERKFGTLPRPRRFSMDSRTVARVAHDDYTNSGFDRGHMVPNFAIASRFGEAAQAETFLMSNIVPQAPALNQGPWRILEETLAEKTSVAAAEIWVVVGPIYDNNVEELRSGSEIPDAFFLVVADETPQGPRTQAFILPQTATRSSNFRTYRTTVQDVQLKTGLNFFWELPDPLETRLEAEFGPYWLEERTGT